LEPGNKQELYVPEIKP